MKGLDTRYENVDLVIVRENTEDLYAGIEHRVGRDAAESIKIITREASERIARYAFEYAVANGRRTVTAVHKANIMKLSDGLFLESCRTIAAEYEGRVAFEDRIVDNMCMQLVQKPEQYDVLVAAEPLRRHHQRPRGRARRRAGRRAGREHRHGGGRLRAGPRVGPQVRRPEQGQPHGAHPVGRADAPPPRRSSAPRSGWRTPSGGHRGRHLHDVRPRRHRRDQPDGRRDHRPSRRCRLVGRRRQRVAPAPSPGRPSHRPDRQPSTRPRRMEAHAPMTARSAAPVAVKPAGTAPAGLGRTRRRDRWWVAPGVQGTLFTICATYLFVSGLLLDARSSARRTRWTAISRRSSRR